MQTRPIKQWAVRREFQRRMKRAFDERDIEIPFPYRTITFATPKEREAALKALEEKSAPETGAKTEREE